MITIPRSLVRQIRSVFQRIIGRSTRNHAGTPVVFDASADALTIRATGPEAAIEYRLSGEFEPAQFAIQPAVLARCEGRKDMPVQFELLGPKKLRLSWHDGVVPRTHEIDTSKVPNQIFPALPETLQPTKAGFLSVMHAAAETTDPESSRYALGCIQLRGRLGQVVGTDGRQLLVQSGFAFPWTDDLLVPGLAVLCSRELPSNAPVQIGRSEKHVTLTVGPWTIHLAINKDGRFPRVDDVVPAISGRTARLELHSADAEFLLETIGHLPGADTFNQPITLDLNGQVVVRARSESEPRPTEVILSNSRLEGDPLRLNSGREFLARAARLGFREFSFFGASGPVLAQADDRRYVWMGLGAETAVRPADHAVRIESPLATGPASIPQNRIKERIVTRITSAAADTSPPATKPNQQSKPAGTQSPVEQVIALRDALHSAARQANELARSLKRQKRQNRLVESTLESLKQLQAAS